MSTKSTIEQTLNVSDMLMDKYLADIAPEAFLARPVHGMNHLAWQVGHLISTEHRFMEQIKPGTSPALPADFHAKYSRDTHTSDEAGDFHTKDELLGFWKAQRAATRAIFDAMGEDDLAGQTPDEKTRAMAPTLGALFNLAGLHALMHSGQFVAVRRQAELPIAF